MSRNPHHAGYGLEDLDGACLINAGRVAILIMLDMGWKPKAYTLNTDSFAVAILIMLDMGWKQSLFLYH